MRLDALLDRSVLFSFDRTGFARHARTFGDTVERDLDGATVLVTGGTSGIGLAAAGALAARGAHVHLWARDEARGRTVEAALRDEGGRATFTPVDLSDLAAVADAAARLLAGRLAALICAAGSMPRTRLLTPQGHEHTWATHVLGHVLLLRRLHAQGHLGRGARVVFVSSGGMLLARADVRDLRRDLGYQRHRVYAHAKRAQVIVASHLGTCWPEVQVTAMHPGWVDTPALRAGMPLFRSVLRPLLRTPDEGADTAVWLSTRQEPIPHGRFWFDRLPAPKYPLASTRETPDQRAALLREILGATEPFLPPPPPSESRVD